MKIEIGIIKNIRIDSNKDGGRNVVLLDCQLSSLNDIQTVQLFTLAGDDSVPVEGAKVIVLALSDSWKVGVAVSDLIEPESLTGEKILYSQKNGEKVTRIYLKNDGAVVIESLVGGSSAANIKLNIDGTLELNGDSDNAVRFSALLEAFEALKLELTKHVHAGVSSGNEATQVPTQPFNSSILLAKIDNLKVSGI